MNYIIILYIIPCIDWRCVYVIICINQVYKIVKYLTKMYPNSLYW